jgi:hypothetical protein
MQSPYCLYVCESLLLTFERLNQSFALQEEAYTYRGKCLLVTYEEQTSMETAVLLIL